MIPRNVSLGLTIAVSPSVIQLTCVLELLIVKVICVLPESEPSSILTTVLVSNLRSGQSLVL